MCIDVKVATAVELVMPEDELPTIGDLVSNWLGVQLPTIPLPQTLRNIDKAIGKIVLAGERTLRRGSKPAPRKQKPGPR
jgi:hypothetical protein